MTVETPAQDDPPVAGAALPRSTPVGPAPQQAWMRTYLCGSWSVIEAAGDVDLAVAPVLREMLHRTTSSRLVFDLRGVGFMDCSALGVLTEAWRRAGAADGAVRLVAPSRAVRRLLEVSMLDRMLPSYPSVEEATY